jgi:hypothetical protein
MPSSICPFFDSGKRRPGLGFRRHHHTVGCDVLSRNHADERASSGKTRLFHMSPALPVIFKFA